jgi:hypothetical protein
MTHTPGPWAVNPMCAWIDCAQLDVDGDPTPLAKLAWPTKYRSEEETWANARLIAAAPDLLAALGFMVNVARATPGFSAMARQDAERVIAKAKGEA